MLWYRVLAARYGDVGSRIFVGGRTNSVWWKNISSINVGDGLGVRNWFLDILGRIVGDGSTTLFWWVPWLNECFKR